MEIEQNTQRSPQRRLVAVVGLALFSGAVYYLLFRWQGSFLAQHWPWFDNLRGGISDPTGGALPGMLHMLALGCLSTALLGLKQGMKLILALLIMTVAAEFTVGVFDWADVYFAVVGALLAIVLASQIYNRAVDSRYATDQGNRRKTAIASAALVACSGLFIGATYPCIMCGPDYRGPDYSNNKPVYLSYSELRNAVSVEPPRELNDIGRLYLYRNYLFLNKRNQGIHVIDNSDPQNPVNTLFISVPGNTELSIRDNYLYADSYIDLITLDLNDPSNIQVVDRRTDIFPWDEYQNVPSDIYFSYADIDVNRGVVVGYER